MEFPGFQKWVEDALRNPVSIWTERLLRPLNTYRVLMKALVELASGPGKDQVVQHLKHGEVLEKVLERRLADAKKGNP
jgi:hypothetical protein